MKPYSTLRIDGTTETCQLKAGGDGDITFEFTPPAGRAIITLAGLAWSYVVGTAEQVLPGEETIAILVNNYANETFRIGTRQAGPQVIYFEPAYEFVLDNTSTLVISMSDPGGGNGNFYLNLLGFNYREVS